MTILNFTSSKVLIPNMNYLSGTMSGTASLVERLRLLKELHKAPIQAPPISYIPLSEYRTLQMIFGMYIRNRYAMYLNHLEGLKCVLDTWYVNNSNIEFKGLALPAIATSFKSHTVSGLRYDIQQIALYLHLPEHYIEYIFHEVIRNEFANETNHD